MRILIAISIYYCSATFSDEPLSFQHVMDDLGNIYTMEEEQRSGFKTGNLVVKKITVRGDVDTDFGNGAGIYAHQEAAQRYPILEPKLHVHSSFISVLGRYTNERKNVWVIKRIDPSGKNFSSGFGERGTWKHTDSKELHTSLLTLSPEGKPYLIGLDPVEPATLVSQRWLVNGEVDGAYANNGYGSVSFPSYKILNIKRVRFLDQGKVAVATEVIPFGSTQHTGAVFIYDGNGHIERVITLHDKRFQSLNIEDISIAGEEVFVLGEVTHLNGVSDCFVSHIKPNSGLDMGFAEEGFALINTAPINRCTSMFLDRKNQRIVLVNSNAMDGVTSRAFVISIPFDGRLKNGIYWTIANNPVSFRVGNVTADQSGNIFLSILGRFFWADEESLSIAGISWMKGFKFGVNGFTH